MYDINELSGLLRRADRTQENYFVSYQEERQTGGCKVKML